MFYTFFICYALRFAHVFIVRLRSVLNFLWCLIENTGHPDVYTFPFFKRPGLLISNLSLNKFARVIWPGCLQHFIGKMMVPKLGFLQVCVHDVMIMIWRLVALWDGLSPG